MTFKKTYCPSFFYIVLGILFSFLLSSKTICAQENSSSTKEYGWFTLNTNLAQFYLVIDGDFEHSILTRSDEKIKLESGVRNLLIVWENINDKKITVEISPNSTTSERVIFASFHRSPNTSFLTLQAGRNLEIITDQKSDIYVDGEQIGTSSAKLFLSEGDYELFIEHPEFGSLKKRFVVSTKEITSIARFNENHSKTPFALKLLPGVGYLSNKQISKSILTYSLLATSIVSALYINDQYTKNNNLYDEQFSSYLSAETTNEAIRFREQAQSTLDKMDSQNRQITLLSATAFTIYVITTLDSFRKPKEGYRVSKKIRPQLGISQNALSGSLYPELTLSKRF